MRRVLLAIVPLALAVSAGASAQTYGAGRAPALPPGAAATQLELEQSYLLSLYLMRASSAGGTMTPEQLQQLQQAEDQYFTNGAEATAVPSTGAGAAYFENGAAVMQASAQTWPESPDVAGTTPVAGDAGAAPAPTTTATQMAPVPPVPAVTEVVPTETATAAQDTPPSGETAPAPTAAPSAPPSETTTVPEPPPPAAALTSMTPQAAPPAPSAPMVSSSPSPTPAEAAAAGTTTASSPGVPWLPPLAGGGILGALVTIVGRRLRPPRKQVAAT